MVTTRISSRARDLRKWFDEAIEIFGKTLTIKRYTETVDAYGQLSNVTSTTETFKGDLQFGLDLDQRFISVGFVEVGDAILYIKSTTLSTLPEPQDVIVDGNSEWEIVSRIEGPWIGNLGDRIFYTYRCTRRINSSDS